MRGLQRENQRLTDTIQMKNHEIEELYSAVRSLETQNTDLQSKFSTLAQYENKIALLTQELERVNSQLRDKSSRHDELVRDKSYL